MMIEPGQTIELTYPDCTLVEALAKFERRRIRVHRVRDLVAEPLTPAEYLRRPKQRRSRWLVFGYDLDRCVWRKFYVGSSREYERPGVLRVGIYRPGETVPADLISREFGPTARERLVLARVLAEWNNANLGRMRLGVIADDFSVCVA
jgi:hypothetical protein